MDTGVMDNSDGGLTQAGHVLGMIMTIFWALVLILGIVALGIIGFLVPSSSGFDPESDGYGVDTVDDSGYYDSQDEMGMHDEGNPMGIDMGMAAGGDDILGDLEIPRRSGLPFARRHRFTQKEWAMDLTLNMINSASPVTFCLAWWKPMGKLK
jgi:hypothetical protein